MPEGPEIKIAATRIAKAIEGEICREVEIGFEPLAEFRGRLDGQLVLNVRSHSKALMVEFESGLTLYAHSQLYGRWMVRRSRQYPVTNRQLRIGLHTDKASVLLYSATQVYFLTPEELETQPYLVKLGPDILSPDFTTKTVRDRLKSPQFRNRQLSALYLEQGFLAGPGNYLRCEILFVAKVSPWLRPADLDAKARNRLAKATCDLAARALETKGLTVADKLRASLKSKGSPKRDYRHYAYGRAGRPCHVCGDAIVRVDKSGRGLYFCPICQGVDH